MVQQITGPLHKVIGNGPLISHYATQGPGQHLLPGLEEATSDDNHLCSSVYSHSQTMTDPRSKSRNTTFSDTVSAYRCACIHLDQGSVGLSRIRPPSY